MGTINSKIKGEDIELLFEAILKLENKDECYRFFEDIATITELKSLSQRILVAKLLKEKKTYTEIAEETGASTATISRVNRCLNYGSDGYSIILDRINSEKVVNK
ncbi:YerC/YecD family TrpR-related protein [Clostridium sp. Ade.TY]|uniref:YerC/YecD family TrpR-related protein n=1 Tax=Clostridium sp. Ade.TY TaxID=1391647 RepID=UPI00040D69C7|nr:YerC/YecD family TrpR-related protein [Clostridium sp. Ade.TY]